MFPPIYSSASTSTNAIYHKYHVINNKSSINVDNKILIQGFVRKITNSRITSKRTSHFSYGNQLGNQRNINDIIFKYVENTTSLSKKNRSTSCQLTLRNTFNNIKGKFLAFLDNF